MPLPKHSAPPVLRVLALGNSTAELLIYGDIGESWSASKSVTASEVVEQLNQLSGVSELIVRINSYGGSVTDGLAIYNALRRHPARKTVCIDGIAASIASMIAMAGDTVQMPGTALMMLHAPWSSATGNADELRRFADVLDGWAAAMAEAYAAKTGQPAAAMLALLNDGTDHWYTGEEAVEAGFADETVTFGDGADAGAGVAAPVVDASAFAHGLARFIPRAPAGIAASLRTFSQGTPAMPNAAPRTDPLAALRDRNAEIRAIASYQSHDPEIRAYVDRVVDQADLSVTPAIVGQNILRILGARCEPLGGGAAVYAGGGGSSGRSGEDFIGAAADALVIRAGIRVDKPHAGARDFMTMDAGDLARACLSRAGRSTRDLDRVGAIRAALSTSDFPALLGNALGKSLRQGYEIEPQSHVQWGRFVQVEDFKPQVRAILSSAPELLHVPEGGEYENGALDEDSAAYAVSKYGRIIRLTWEALINDDLGAFVRVPQAMGQAARRKEADLAYGLFAANAGAGPTMQDGVTLFAAAHANLGTAASALDAAALSAARTMLRKQTAKGGGLLNLQPRYLIVPVEHETAAESLVATSARAVAAGADNAVLPGWIGNLQLIVEPRLDAGAFYLAASADQVDTLEIAGLSADGGRPVVEEESEFNRDAKAWKVRHVVAAAFTDWRGIVKVPLSA